mmetsp:Transcript_27663/g.76086  ORF Transcript_27663/g.76086 Transcript_27663/m.76086 type:complete len:219 (-) Transcript_27663:14-670(-)
MPAQGAPAQGEAVCGRVRPRQLRVRPDLVCRPLGLVIVEQHRSRGCLSGEQLGPLRAGRHTVHLCRVSHPHDWPQWSALTFNGASKALGTTEAPELPGPPQVVRVEPTFYTAIQLCHDDLIWHGAVSVHANGQPAALVGLVRQPCNRQCRPLQLVAYEQVIQHCGIVAPELSLLSRWSGVLVLGCGLLTIRCSTAVAAAPRGRRCHGHLGGLVRGCPA